MDLRLTGNVVLITGASAGIGEATLRLLAAEGAEVVGVARSASGLTDVGPRATGIDADVADAGTASRVVTRSLAATGVWTGWSTTSGPCIPARASSRSATTSGTPRSR
ncbi:hypothetical protein BH23ACT8_BH23ACT8_14350 [soil metagenome]